MRILCATSLLLVAAGCAGLDMRAINQECQRKYGVALPEGAILAKPVVPMRIAPQRRENYAYACVVVTVNEMGVVTQARLAETDSPAFGEYFLNLVKATKFHPTIIGGKAATHTSVISAGYQ